MTAEKKLYRVEVSSVYYAFTKNESEAEGYYESAMQGGGADFFINEVAYRDVTLAEGWEPGTLVFSHETPDPTLGEILAKLPTRAEAAEKEDK